MGTQQNMQIRYGILICFSKIKFNFRTRSQVKYVSHNRDTPSTLRIGYILGILYIVKFSKLHSLSRYIGVPAAAACMVAASACRAAAANLPSNFVVLIKQFPPWPVTSYIKHVR